MKKKLLKVLSTLLISCNLFVVPASANTWVIAHQYPGFDLNGNHICDWKYKHDDGSYAVGWEFIDDNWYYFDPTNGLAYTNLHTINGQDYFFDTFNCDMKHDQYVRIGSGRHSAMAWACSDGHIDYNNTTFQDYVK